MFVASLAFTMVPSAAIADDWGACSTLGHADWLEPKLYVLVYVTIPDCIFGQVLYQLSVMPVRGLCRFCPRLFSSIAHLNALGLLLFGALMSVMSYAIKQDAAWVCLLFPICSGKLIGWLAWFPLHLLLPCNVGFISLWRREKRFATQLQAARAGTAGGPAVMLEVSEDPHEVLEDLEVPEESLQVEGCGLSEGTVS